MPTVWCIWWRDPENPDKYGAYYVQRLQRTVAENLSIPHRFICITDQEIFGVQTMPPVCDYPGWWQKIGLHKPGVSGPLNLYLDLDVIVTGDLTPLVEALEDHNLAMPLNWAQSGHGGCQSSVMVWRSCQMTQQIYDLFDPADAHWPPINRPGVLWGDQEHVTLLRDSGEIRVRPLPKKYVKSYKYHCRDGLPDDCRVVVFHGEPKPADVRAPWFKW